MKWCVQFPEETILIVRPSLVAICGWNRPAAHLLSVLLYRYSIRKEHKEDAENLNAIKIGKGEEADQDCTYRIYRTQAQLASDMCGEVTEKTLHDTAIPVLQLLGYLDLEEHKAANCYLLHLDLVKQALSLYMPDRKEQPALETFLRSHLQLEKFLISEQLEKFPIDRKNFLSGLEKVLIWNRKTSNLQRGRKPTCEVRLEGISEKPQIIKNKEITRRESCSTSVHPEPATRDARVEAHAPLSHDQQEQTPLIASDGLQEKVVSKSGARKPRTPVDDTLKVRIERVYGYFDTLAQETSGDATYRYQRTKKATTAITEWLKGTPTEELLREVYLELWQTPVDIRSGFDWKRNMHIHSVLAQYDSRSLAIKARRHAAQPKPTTLFTQAAKHVDDDDAPLQYQLPPSQRNKHNRPFQAIAARRA